MNSFNDPLLYIDGPPVFHLPPGVKVEVPKEVQKIVQMETQKKVQDGSTSIYEIRANMSSKSLEILEKLNFLAKPFQRKVYRPLVFHLEGGIYVPGEVEKVDDEMVTFLVGDGDKITYRVDQIQKIVWRGIEMK